MSHEIRTPINGITGLMALTRTRLGGSNPAAEEYLTRAEKDGVVLDVSGDLPKSFVVCDHPYHPQIVYLSQLNTSTLKNRAESGKLVL